MFTNLFDMMYYVWIFQNLYDKCCGYLTNWGRYFYYIVHKDTFSKLAVKTRENDNYECLYDFDSVYATIKTLMDKLPQHAPNYIFNLKQVPFLSSTYPEGIVGKYYDYDSNEKCVLVVYVFGKHGKLTVAVHHPESGVSKRFHHLDKPKALVFLMDNDNPSKSIDLSHAYNQVGILMSKMDVPVDDFLSLCDTFFGIKEVNEYTNYTLNIFDSKQGDIRVLKHDSHI